MPKDVYQDQIMLNHPSRNWTKKLILSLTPVLKAHGWVCVESNYMFYAKFSKNSKTLIINLAHIPDDQSSDYYIGDSVTPTTDWPEFALYPESFGNYLHSFDCQEQTPTKMYNCFINRGCPLRQSWFYFLVRRNLLSQGHVSFWCEDRFTNSTPQQYNEHLYQTHNYTMFKQEHEQMHSQIPYKNFEISLEDAIIDSAKSLVIETFFEPDHYICYSEKTWRAIQMPRPMLLFNSQFAVRHLRDWGFDVFDDVVDHSYDLEADKFVRQRMILDQLETPVTYDAELFQKRAQHNKNVLKQLQARWDKKYNKLLETISTISKQ
jgi:hypothetical protein